MRSVVAVGRPAIPVLSRACEDANREDLRPLQYSVEAIAKIGGQEALYALAELEPNVKANTLDALVRGWSYFDPREYALRVLREVPIEGPRRVKIADSTLARHTGLVDSRVYFACVLRNVPEDIGEQLAGSRLDTLVLSETPNDIDFSFLGEVRGLTSLDVAGVGRFLCRSITSLEAIASLELEELRIEGTDARTEIDDSRTGLRPAGAEDLTMQLHELWRDDEVDETPVGRASAEMGGDHLQTSLPGWTIISDLAAWEGGLDSDVVETEDPDE